MPKVSMNLLANYTNSIQIKPWLTEAYINRGGAYNKKRCYNLAIADCEKAIQLNPQYAEAYNNRGVVYWAKGEVRRAIEDYNTAIRLNSKYAEAYNNRGIVYMTEGEIDFAIEDYNTAIQLNPDYAEAYNNRGNTYYEKGDYDRAIKDHNTAIKLEPDSAIAYNNRGIIYREKKNFDFAIRDCTKAIELNPNFVEAYHNRAVVYNKKGETELAIEDYNTAIQLNPNEPNTYYDRGNTYHEKGETELAIEDYTKAIELNPKSANAYNNRGVAYGEKDDADYAIENYNKAIELNPNHNIAYYNRGIVWLHLQKWDKAKSDLTTAKRLGTDIIANFHNSYKDVETYQKNHFVKLPEDLALLLTQRRRDRYPKLQKVLDADGNPLESPDVVNLREQLRNAGPPLSDYLNAKPAFGINTAPTEVFVVDNATQNELIETHPASANILKPFLHGQDLRRWHVDTPQQWLIFTYRGIAIDDYPAILKYLEKHKDSLQKRKGKQAWYELPVSFDNAERFAQPKLVCPNTYNYQTFAVDTEGFYYGNTSYLVPTKEKWLCGLLNSRTVEWFYSQVSNQLTIAPLRARSGYIQQIPIPNITPVHKALIAKIVDYLIYLQQQPEINSKDLKYARDRIMLGYFERVIDGLVYEAYLPAELHKSDKVFLQPLLDEGFPLIEKIQGDKMSVFRDIFELLYERTHPIRRNLFFIDSVKQVRVIQGKL